jgi:Cu+-exporting ATPase
LGLATPTALLVGTGRGASLGIIVRGPHAIEASASIDTVFLDKTGTITSGELSVVELTTLKDDSRLWNIVIALEETSTHPIARALVRAAHEHGAHISHADKVLSIAGKGVQGHVDGNPATVGSLEWLGAPEGPLRDAATQYVRAGHSVVVVYDDARCIAVIALADAIADDASDAIVKLRNMGIEPVIVSGDHDAAVAHVAASVGITKFYASCSPQKKVELVRAGQSMGQMVAMVGDGVNDAAALAQAHLSMAMGAGTDVAANASDIVLMRSTLSAAVDALRLARATMRTIKLNLVWAFGYNIAAIPLAMTGVINPIISAATMAFSSVFVVTNSLRLRRFK